LQTILFQVKLMEIIFFFNDVDPALFYYSFTLLISKIIHAVLLFDEQTIVDSPEFTLNLILKSVLKSLILKRHTLLYLYANSDSIYTCLIMIN